MTKEQAANYDPACRFHTIERCGAGRNDRVLPPLGLCSVDLGPADFYCAPCLQDVRYRTSAGDWVDITKEWSRLRDVRTNTLLALQLRAGLPLDKFLIADLIDEPLYGISDDACVETIWVLRSLLGGGGQESRFIATHPGRHTGYSWRPERSFIWVSLQPLTLPGLGSSHTP